MSGQTILVTGASGAIGGAISEAMCTSESTVILNYHRGEAAVEALRLRIEPIARRVILCQADLSEPAELQAMLRKIEKVSGAPDILINNSAILAAAAVPRIQLSDWEKTLSLNLTAAMLLIRGVLPHMRELGWGRIVSITSIAGMRGWPFQAAYASSKAGLIGLTKTVALEVAQFGITSNAVAPGYVPSTMSSIGGQGVRDAIVKSTPMRRAGKAQEVAAAVKFLASREASYITGQVLAVDGGQSI